MTLSQIADNTGFTAILIRSRAIKRWEVLSFGKLRKAYSESRKRRKNAQDRKKRCKP